MREFIGFAALGAVGAGVWWLIETENFWPVFPFIWAGLKVSALLDAFRKD